MEDEPIAAEIPDREPVEFGPFSSIGSIFKYIGRRVRCDGRRPLFQVGHESGPINPAW